MPSVFRFFPSTRISDWATGAFGTPAAVPGAPDDLTATAGNTQVVLKWTAGAENFGTITGYKVEKNSGSWSDVTTDTSSTSTSYTVTGLTNGTAYTFRVSAINEIGTGAASSASSSTTPLTVPDAPTSLSASAVAETPNASLSWSAPSGTGGSAITGYAIKRGGTVIVSDTGDTAASYVDGDTAENTAYTYTVAAVNAAGIGAYSSSDSVTTNTVDLLQDLVISGGTTSTYSGYNVRTFTGSGNLTVTQGDGPVDIFMVGGGGGGGTAGWNFSGGGGGAGAAQAIPGIALSSTGGPAGNGVYPVVVGAGGAQGYPQNHPNAGPQSVVSASGGGHTSFNGIIMQGGGHGGNGNPGFQGGNDPSHPNGGVQQLSYGGGGGSGGGAGCGRVSPSGPGHNYYGGYGTGGPGPVGNDGGQCRDQYGAGGSGGGWGGAGTEAPSAAVNNPSGHLARPGAAGGNGNTNNYQTGSNQTYAGGGGGGGSYAQWPQQPRPTGTGAGGPGGGGAGGHGNANYPGEHLILATNGTANTGGGGGGHGYDRGGESNATGFSSGGNGGSGIVVVRWPT